MGLVLCEIRILDGSETITYYGIWNNTSDAIEPNHPLCDFRDTAQIYFNLYNKHPSIREYFTDFHSITKKDINNVMYKKLIEVYKKLNDSYNKWRSKRE